jgi:hypothetical protein
VEVKKETFKAWIDKMPSSNKLIVVGDVVAELVRPVPQGINERILLPKIEVAPPAGVAHSNAIGTRQLRYEEAPPITRYEQVTINSGGDSFTIGVAETQ